MKPIQELTERNLQRVMKISLKSYEFETQLVGKWMRKPSEKEKRKLQEKSSAAKEENQEQLMGFRWFADNMEA